MGNAKVKNIAIFSQDVYEETFPENSYEDFLRANDIFVVMDKIFRQNEDVETLKFIIMDDAYLTFLEKNHLPNNLDSRKAYMKILTPKVLNQTWDDYGMGTFLSYYFIPVQLNLARIPIDRINYVQIATESLRRIERKIESESGLDIGSVRLVDTLFSLEDLQKESIVNELEEIAATAFMNETAATAPNYYEHGITDMSKKFLGMSILMHHVQIPREVTREFYYEFINPETKKISETKLDQDFINKHLSKGIKIDAEVLTKTLLSPEDGVRALNVHMQMLEE